MITLIGLVLLIITDFRNNANVSVVCDPVCNGCFGPGPYLCQECVNTSFYDTNICLSECNEYHLNTSYCHRVAPLPLELYYNTANATCFNFTWSFNLQEPYLETINGVNLLVNDYSIYNYTIDDTGYYYNRNFTDTFEVCGLIPETEYNVTGMLFGNGLMSNHSKMNFATTSYSIENITYVFVGHVNTSTNVLLVWNETQVPGDSYFDSAYSYYQVEITSNVEFNYSNYNLTTRYLIFDLETGLYNIRVRPMMNVTLHNHEYIGEWFSFNFDIFVTPSTTDTSTQTSTPSSTASTTVSSTASTTVSSTASSTVSTPSSSSSSSSSSTSEASGSTTKTPDNKNDDDSGLSTVLIVIIILAVLIFLLLCVLLYLRYNEKKKNDMISRLTGRNRNTDTNPAVTYSNNSFNDPGFTNEDLYSNARYEVGYGDVVVSEESDVGRGAIKNESYDDHYFDC